MEANHQSSLHSFVTVTGIMLIHISHGLPWTVDITGAALLKNNEASAKLTTANGRTFT